MEILHVWKTKKKPTYKNLVKKLTMNLRDVKFLMAGGGTSPKFYSSICMIHFSVKEIKWIMLKSCNIYIFLKLKKLKILF